MAVSALSAARTICELSDWKVSNLALQKILYIAHMFHMGRNRGEPLIREGFEAWDYGPVVPEVYAKARGFGSGPVPNVFHWIPSVEPGTPEFDSLRQTVDATRALTPGQLVNITHRPNGAWAARYRAGAYGVKIPNDDILTEYHARVAAAA